MPSPREGNHRIRAPKIARRRCVAYNATDVEDTFRSKLDKTQDKPILQIKLIVVCDPKCVSRKSISIAQLVHGPRDIAYGVDDDK